MNYHLTKKSSNIKTGPMPVSTTSKDSCPLTCPARDHWCYFDYGPGSIHWKLVSSGKRGTDIDGFCTQVKSIPPGQLWRHNQGGDLPGHGDYIDSEDTQKLVYANRDRSGFTFSHKPVLGHEHAKHNASVIRSANESGFTINLSADSIAEADQMVALNIAPVTVVLPEDTTGNFNTPDGHRVVLCPFETRGIQCIDCGLCARAGRLSIVGFPVHGSGKSKFDSDRLVELR